ncbi:hypothetical protein ACFRCW_07405 [Streptomyces sp. NPDC056653]
MVTERIAPDGIPAAFDNMIAGSSGRALVVVFRPGLTPSARPPTGAW